MTQKEAKNNQRRLSESYDLSFWYGTDCEKCCEVYPKFKHTDGFEALCWYECEVCGKRTTAEPMPWIARDKWNNHEYLEQQIKMF